MKARQSFEVVVDEAGKRVGYIEGENKKVKKILVEAGKEVEKLLSQEHINDLLMSNPDFFELEYKDGKPVLPKGVEAPQRPLNAPVKLTEADFMGITRKDQEVILNDLEIPFTKKDKEADLWKKYDAKLK